MFFVAKIKEGLFESTTVAHVSLCNNNYYFFYANILEDQAQGHDKTKGLSNLVIVKNARVVNGWMKMPRN